VDTCQHRLITDRGEIVCNRCGRVFEKEEERVTRLEEIGWDPHGETSLFQTGLGSLELSRDLKEQDDISIISNIANKLHLPQYAALEFHHSYESMKKDKEKKRCKCSKADKVRITKVALLLLYIRYKELRKGMPLYEIIHYINIVVNMGFGSKQNHSSELFSIAMISPFECISLPFTHYKMRERMNDNRSR
ncbi:MAG: hypothetical protein QW293_07870, partial [Candidatus Nitrosocaldaceae archaeon]